MAITVTGGSTLAASDATLVRGALNGDQAAFGELYDRRARLIRALCYDETHDAQTAADLTQEAFLRAYRSLSRLHDPDRFGAWLIGIAKQVCREWRRGRRREQRGLAALTADQRAAATGPPADPPDQRLVVLRDEIAGLLAHDDPAVKPLTEQQRLALHAYYLQDRSVEEARAILGLSRSGFFRALSSACERLRRLVNTREVLR